MVAKYFNREVAKEAYAACPTKPYRYVPVNESISTDLQAVFPYHTMEEVVRQAQRFAVAHCPCRMAGQGPAEPASTPSRCASSSTTSPTT